MLKSAGSRPPLFGRAALAESRYVWVALAVLGLAALACGGFGGGQLAVAILSPAPGSSVPVNQPVTVQASATDSGGPGVSRIDLQVDGVTVDTFEVGGPQAAVAAELTFTPAAEGAISVSVIAFRQNGKASAPATIALSVTGAETASGEQTGAPDGAPPEPPAPPEPTEARVPATAKLDVPIRAECSPGCPQIGVWKKSDTGDLLIRTTSPTEWWYWTDYLGPDQLGCVYQGQEAINFTLHQSDDILPREPEQGCLYCGDGVCTASMGEACDTCEEDCGSCCGNGVCEEAFGEACDICVPDCGVCPFCGDGEVNQPSEECDSGGCDEGYACEACTCVQLGYCGDGIVQPELGEQCESDAGCEGIFTYGGYCESCQCLALPY